MYSRLLFNTPPFRLFCVCVVWVTTDCDRLFLNWNRKRPKYPSFTWWLPSWPGRPVSSIPSSTRFRIGNIAQLTANCCADRLVRLGSLPKRRRPVRPAALSWQTCSITRPTRTKWKSSELLIFTVVLPIKRKAINSSYPGFENGPSILFLCVRINKQGGRKSEELRTQCTYIFHRA